MPLTPDDEFQHRPAGMPRWQENYFVIGWDDVNAAGIYLHLAHSPAEGHVEVKAAVSLGEDNASHVMTQPGDDCFAVPDVKVEVVDPFRQWRITLDTVGAPAGDDGWLADAGGDLPFGFAITADSTLAPADWAPAAAAWGLPEVVTQHYELAAAWHGQVWCGDRRIDAAGLLVRDHSWGPRDFGVVDHGWWTPMVFDDARAFLTGTTMLVGGRWMGLTLVDTGDGPRLSTDHWVRVAGRPEPGGYTAATVLGIRPDGGMDRCELECRAHFPVRYPEFGAGHFINDAIGPARWGERRGFGVVELNRR